MQICREVDGGYIYDVNLLLTKYNNWMVQFGPPLVIEQVTFVNVIKPEITLIDEFLLWAV